MRSKIKKLEGTSREMFIEISKEKVDSIFDGVLKDIQKEAQLPGFRQGKVPMDIINKNYSADAADEVKRRIIPEAYNNALDEYALSPVSFPKVEDVVLDPSGKLMFKVTVDIYPDVELKRYTGIKVTADKVSVMDKEVDEALEKLRSASAEFVPVEKSLEKGDYAICDVETFMDGEVIAKKRQDMWIEVDKEASLLGMGEELAGLSKGDKKDIEVTLPEGYPDKKYAGKKAFFRVEVKDVKIKNLPELNDEFAKKVGNDDLGKLKESMKSGLMERKEANLRIHMKNQIIKELLKKHSFDLPGTMVERQLKVLIERSENELVSKGVSKEEVEKHKDKISGQLSKEASDKVKLYFILDKIAEKEEISVSGEEIDAWLKSLAESFNQPFENVKKYYTEKDLLGGVSEQLKEEKTLDYLLDKAEIVGK